MEDWLFGTPAVPGQEKLVANIRFLSRIKPIVTYLYPLEEAKPAESRGVSSNDLRYAFPRYFLPRTVYRTWFI